MQNKLQHYRNGKHELKQIINQAKINRAKRLCRYKDLVESISGIEVLFILTLVQKMIRTGLAGRKKLPVVPLYAGLQCIWKISNQIQWGIVYL